MVEWKGSNGEIGWFTGINRKLSDQCYNGNLSGDLLLCTVPVTRRVKCDCLILETSCHSLNRLTRRFQGLGLMHFREGEQWSDILFCLGFLLKVEMPTSWSLRSATVCPVGELMASSESSRTGMSFIPNLTAAPWSHWKMSWDHGNRDSQVRKGPNRAP